MRVCDIKSESQYQVTANKALGIQNYDTENNFPEKIEDITTASGTASKCLDIRLKFLFGLGFPESVSNTIINPKGHTLNEFAKSYISDYNKYGGYAIHINYNANYIPVSFECIPFDHCRLTLPDEDTGRIQKIAVHPDWCKRFTSIKKFKKSDIDYIDLFNPNPEIIQYQVDCAGGWKRYKGQILWFSTAGNLIYPSPFYVSQLKNMRTEEALDTISLRNAGSGFRPSIVLVDINNTDQSEEQLNATKEYIDSSIGDENSNNVCLIQVDSKEEIPQKIDLQGENYDKAFTVTQAYVPDRIGKIFNQPPILRAEDVGNNFGANALKNAYSFYNAVTEQERNEFSNVVKRLVSISHFNIDQSEIYLRPVTYSVGTSVIDRLSEQAVKDIIELISKPEAEISDSKKRAILEHCYGLEQKEINEMLTIN